MPNQLFAMLNAMVLVHLEHLQAPPRVINLNRPVGPAMLFDPPPPPLTEQELIELRKDRIAKGKEKKKKDKRLQDREEKRAKRSDEKQKKWIEDKTREKIEREGERKTEKRDKKERKGKPGAP